MNHLFRFFLLTCLIFLTSSPSDSLARAGRGSSFGSRGSHTWSAPKATSMTSSWSHPIERSWTPPSHPHRTHTIEEEHISTVSQATESKPNPPEKKDITPPLLQRQTTDAKVIHKPILTHRLKQRTALHRKAAVLIPPPLPVTTDNDNMASDDEASSETVPQPSVSEDPLPSTSTPTTSSQKPSDIPVIVNPDPPPIAPAQHYILTDFVYGFLGSGLCGLIGDDISYNDTENFGYLLGICIQIATLFYAVLCLIKAQLRQTCSYTNNLSPQQRPSPLLLEREDFIAFQSLLLQIQAAWSAQNISALKSMTTPEMAQYFGEQLSDLSSRGARNILSDVRFLQGDLSEAWREGNLTYATVAMRYSLIDVTTDSLGNVIDGSQTEPQIVTELWTFVKADGRGNWVLSAIQQAG